MHIQILWIILDYHSWWDVNIAIELKHARSGKTKGAITLYIMT
uniref:Uncharacterized protein n=1 Tax=Arundo donax TaxID=35708 RepID=A0A0A9DM91_ARUDO